MRPQDDSAWTVEHHTGSAAAFHERPLPSPVRRSVWWFVVDRPALVLGSAQDPAVVDAAAVARAGLDLVRRHSGGGAVLLVPGDVSWVDLLVPERDPLWDDDVGRAFDWLGDVWVATLASLGVEEPRAHRGSMRRTKWSDLVCFAGLGRGEVTVAGRKVLGISQRRTRAGARFQCALLHRWDPAALVDALALEPTARRRASAALAGVAAGVSPQKPSNGTDQLESAFLSHLPE